VSVVVVVALVRPTVVAWGVVFTVITAVVGIFHGMELHLGEVPNPGLGVEFTQQDVGPWVLELAVHL